MTQSLTSITIFISKSWPDQYLFSQVAKTTSRFTVSNRYLRADESIVKVTSHFKNHSNIYKYLIVFVSTIRLIKLDCPQFANIRRWYALNSSKCRFVDIDFKLLLTQQILKTMIANILLLYTFPVLQPYSISLFLNVFEGACHCPTNHFLSYPLYTLYNYKLNYYFVYFPLFIYFLVFCDILCFLRSVAQKQKKAQY